MEFENGDIILMDGGFPMDQVEKADPLALWITEYNETNPEAVIQNHISYLRAGSKLLKTNTYQATIEGFMNHKNLTKDQAEQKIIEGVNLCHKAIKLYQESDDCDKERTKILVVGSIGTYGAHLHDGSDYTGNFAERVTKKDVKDFHRQQVNALVNSNIDALAFETIPCQMEGEAIAELLAEEYPGVKAWISFQCKDELHLAHGELFHEAAEKCWEIPKGELLAVGVNCVNPRNVLSIVKSLNGKRNEMIPLVLYPNSGKKYVPNKGWQDKDKCPDIIKDVDQWFAFGCKIVGGGCRTTTDDVAKLRDAISAWRMNGQTMN